MDYEELKEKATSVKEGQKARAKENYHYARSLGFSATESMLLQFRSKEEIDRTAKDRDERKLGDGA
jgi:hypothetical protein